MDLCIYYGHIKKNHYVKVLVILSPLLQQVLLN